MIESVNFKINRPNKKRIKLLCNWTDNKRITEYVSKMLKDDRFELVTGDSDVDLYIVFNTSREFHVPEKSVLFQMEPTLMYNTELNYKRVYTAENSFTNLEWHISKTYSELLRPYDKPKQDQLSAVLSNKYHDEGHKFRVDLISYLDLRRFPLTVFGNSCWRFFNSYNPTELPSFNKDLGLFPFKYHLAVENHSIKGYTTEKLIDGIMSECLTFYWGGPDCIINEKAFIRLNKNMPFSEIEILIRNYIDNDEWSKRIDIIRIEKLRILNNLTCFCRIENLF
jgi:hypothetical protein